MRPGICAIVLSTLLSLAGAGPALAAENDSLGDKLKKIFASPTPTPHKRHKASPTPTPSASPKKKATPKESPSPSPSASPAKSKTKAKAEEEKHEETPEPSQTPRHKASGSPSPAKSSSGKRHHSPTPGEEEESPAKEKESPTITPSPSAEQTPSPAGKGNHAAVSSIASGQIAGYDNNPPAVRQLLDRALGLTTQNLDYKYGSADPSNGGMDCSGFIYYVLSQSGVKEVPRDSAGQYVWARKAGTFQAVVSRKDDTFELDALKPGDLLFWTGTYQIERDPPVTHTMIYLGREKGSNQRIMVGSSDGRTYKGQSRFGVSVFDFKVPGHSRNGDNGNSDTGPHPMFIGYARVPGL